MANVSLPEEVNEAVAAERLRAEQQAVKVRERLDNSLQAQERLRASTAQILSGRDDWFDYEGGLIDSARAITDLAVPRLPAIAIPPNPGSTATSNKANFMAS